LSLDNIVPIDYLASKSFLSSTHWGHIVVFTSENACFPVSRWRPFVACLPVFLHFVIMKLKPWGVHPLGVESNVVCWDWDRQFRSTVVMPVRLIDMFCCWLRNWLQLILFSYYTYAYLNVTTAVFLYFWSTWDVWK